MTFNDYKAYRQTMKPILEQKRLLRGNPPEVFDHPPQISLTKKVLFTLGITGLVILGSCSLVHASEIPADKAIRCVIGEAENQGFIGMLALSHAIRNRGTLKGCYGLTSPRVRHHLYSHRIYLMAQQAWEQSGIDYDLTHGATGWGNAGDLDKFARCKWWRNCTVTFMYRDHWFYKGVL